MDNLYVIDFDWYNLWRLWPVVLVLWGISVLPVKDIIKVVLVLLVLGASVTYMMNNTVRWNEDDFEITFNDDDCDYRSIEQEFTIPFEDTVDNANLEMEIAAGKYTLTDDSYNLLDFEKSGTVADHKYTITQLDNSVDIDIYMEDEFNIKKNSHNRVTMSLNPYPIWDMRYEVGAADLEMDFSNLKIENLDIEGGAASIVVKLGDAHYLTNVKIESGASSIKIKVPEESGCDLNISAVLSGKSISGFKKVDHGHYQTENFDEAANKIYVDVETAVSSYSIIRY